MDVGVREMVEKRCVRVPCVQVPVDAHTLEQASIASAVESMSESMTVVGLCPFRDRESENRDVNLTNSLR